MKGPQFHLPPNLRTFGAEHLAGDPRMEYASHQQTLVGAVLRSTGPVLELGAGNYSTPILHELCRAGRRHLVTLERDPPWFKRFAPLACEWHTVELVDDWAQCAAIDLPYGVVFVDHDPTERRALELVRIKRTRPRFVVVHDTEPRYAHQYPGLDEALALFTYRRDFSGLEPWTSVVSDAGPIWSE